jgi:hypothetical protein
MLNVVNSVEKYFALQALCSYGLSPSLVPSLITQAKPGRAKKGYAPMELLIRFIGCLPYPYLGTKNAALPRLIYYALRALISPIFDPGLRSFNNAD